MNAKPKQFKNEAERNRILERIKKILALAQGTSYQGEAETAMAMAQSYMKQYGLSMSDVEIGAMLDEEIIDLPLNKRKESRCNWDRALSSVVALLTDTKNYIDGKSHLRFIGYKSDVEFAVLLYDIFWVSVSAASLAQFPGKSTYGFSLFKEAARSFRDGCVYRLYERAKEEKQEAIQPTTGSTNKYGLIVGEKKTRIEKWAEENLDLKDTNPKMRKVNVKAFEDGKAHANKMDLMNKEKMGNTTQLQLGRDK